MGKRTRHRRPPERPRDPELSLLEAIAGGQLDDHLTGLAEAIHARRQLLYTVRSATALSSLCVGDRVRVNRAVSPRYLIGLQGTVVDVDDQAATISLQRPVGRFKSGQVRCPPLALDKLNAPSMHRGAPGSDRQAGLRVDRLVLDDAHAAAEDLGIQEGAH